jgi:TIR domain/Pentapeptide repeats (8 copies)
LANQEHLDILKQGVEAWNEWRQQHPMILPELAKADLYEANLSGANLTQAYLHEANLVRSNLVGAQLFAAHLHDTDIYAARLVGANLVGAYLRRTNFNRADLRRANLSGAILSDVNFVGCNLDGANLATASMMRVIFGEIDFRMVQGLDTVKHTGPSNISLDAIYRSQGEIPEVFLRGAGIPDSFIDYMRSLVGKPIDYYTCFISHSNRDKSFAERLYADLQSNGIRCWFAPEDLKIGAKIRPSIDESIRLHDKLLLVLSQHSMASQWVEQEVERALAREHKENKVVLFPIRLDDAVMDIEEGWSAFICNTRNIGDFTRWKHHDEYQKAFTRLLRDLKN